LRGGDSTILYLDSILSGSYVRTLILTIALLCTYILVCGIWSLRFRNS
jgi:hypothetical protein